MAGPLGGAEWTADGLAGSAAAPVAVKRPSSPRPSSPCLPPFPTGEEGVVRRVSLTNCPNETLSLSPSLPADGGEAGREGLGSEGPAAALRPQLTRAYDVIGPGAVRPFLSPPIC